jgi:hypothetical protein
MDEYLSLPRRRNLLINCLFWLNTLPLGTLLDRVLTCGLSPVGAALGEGKRVKLGGRPDGAAGVVDTLRVLLHKDDYCTRGSLTHRFTCLLLIF